jgi:uncharacterized sulfatase
MQHFMRLFHWAILDSKKITFSWCQMVRFTCCASFLLLAIVSQLPAADSPNILIVMADDCTYNDLPIYGGANAQTPNIDAFAKESLVFNRAYLCEAMCQPCRAELYSGQFPLRNGCAWNHSASRNQTRSMPHYLQKLGYRTGLAGKVHVKPDSAFPFEKVPGFEPNCVRNPTRAHDLTGVAEFIARDAAPFCLVIALVEPHVPWVMGDATQYPVDKIKLPENIADTEQTRDDFAHYLAEITYMDSQFGEILKTLQQSGKQDDTIVLFTSEQGAQFPGCKWTNWDTGLHTALIARWPGKIAADKRTDAMVQYADVLPTLIDVAGGSVPEETILDGRSFLQVLRGQTDAHRDLIFGVHNNIPEGPAYPIRTVFDGEFRYIRNLTPDEIYIEKHLMGKFGDGKLNNPYWTSWVFEASENPRTYELVKRYTRRPAEQLYHTMHDRYEMNNLADQPELAALKKRLSDALDQWLTEQGDPGIEQDTRETFQAAKQGKHIFFPHTP